MDAFTISIFLANPFLLYQNSILVFFSKINMLINHITSAENHIRKMITPDCTFIKRKQAY
jgi:hypothetical protein